MSNENIQVKSGGIGFCSLLTIVFIALKLTGYISWSWLWVLAPLWLGAAVAIGLIILLAIFVSAFKD